eukprot:EG_transcript_10674
MRARLAQEVLLDKKKRRDYDHELRRYGADPLERQQTLSVQLWFIGRNERPLPGAEMERHKNNITMALRKKFIDSGADTYISELRIHDRGPAYIEVDRKKVDDRFRTRTRLEIPIHNDKTLLLKVTRSSKENEERTRAGQAPRPEREEPQRRSPPRRRSLSNPRDRRARSPPGRRRASSRSRSRSPSHSRSRSGPRSWARNDRSRRSPARPPPSRGPSSAKRARSTSPVNKAEEQLKAEVERMRAELERLKKQNAIEEELARARQEMGATPQTSPHGHPHTAPPESGKPNLLGKRCCWHCQEICDGDGDYCTNCGGCLFRPGCAKRRRQLCPEGVIFCAKCGLKGLRRKACPTCGFENPVFT